MPFERVCTRSLQWRFGIKAPARRNQQMEDLEPPAPEARLRAGPPCVALQSVECRAAPSRGCQYSFVPEAYRVLHELNANASVCTSLHCKRFVKLLPPVGKPGRPPKRRHGAAEETVADGPMRGLSPSLRQQPTEVVEVFELKAVRRTAVDCDRQTTDEAVQAARRNALPRTLSAPNEYQVHGLFKMESGDRAFPDTYNFTLAQLQAAGLSKALLQDKLLEFSQLLKLECDKELGELDEPEEQPDQQPEQQPEGQPP